MPLTFRYKIQALDFVPINPMEDVVLRGLSRTLRFFTPSQVEQRLSLVNFI